MLDSNRRKDGSSRFSDFILRLKSQAMALILASASPRRQELLRNAGIVFTVQAANIAEAPIAGESPQACATRLALQKTRAVCQQRPADYVLGADTIVVVNGEVLGKPCDEEDARRMLHLLSGRTHEVITGVCLAGPEQGTRTSVLLPAFEDTRFERTTVSMSALTDEDIRQYVATREPEDKAGAYAIQGVTSRWIHRIEGDYFNVVGLPVSLVYRMLREHGAIESEIQTAARP
jgi:septum formation protein